MAGEPSVDALNAVDPVQPAGVEQARYTSRSIVRTRRLTIIDGTILPNSVHSSSRLIIALRCTLEGASGRHDQGPAYRRVHVSARNRASLAHGHTRRGAPESAAYVAA